MITVCIFSNEDNIIYNKISDTRGSRPYYPHIFYSHDFHEEEITDDSFYEKAIFTGQKYGNDGIFMSVKDQVTLDEFIAKLCFCVPGPIVLPISEINDFAALLSLSATMTASFKQLMCYYGCTHNVSEYLSCVKSEYNLPVATKQEGKKIYEHIRKEILG